MRAVQGDPAVRSHDGLTRRDFLRAGILSGAAAGFALAEGAAARDHATAGAKSCILLFLVGGPSHLDTWDPKPDAPDQVRGPFRSIPTNVPGIRISELFPRMAQRADRYAIVRSVHHREAAIHETGHQLMQTGRVFRNGVEYPHYGAVVAHLGGSGRRDLPPFVVLPRPIGNTGAHMGHGQGAGFLGTRYEGYCPGANPTHPVFDLSAERSKVRDRYGDNPFGRSCLLARRLVEQGVRFVTVNMFETVFDQITWDCHADGGSLGSTLEDYRDVLGPTFDAAYTSLLDDLQQRGLLETTLVVAMGEFGRTPRLNSSGGRDHWPGVWSILFAGGPVRGGQVIGASDRLAAEPRDRPVTPAELAATVYRGLGIDPGTYLNVRGSRSIRLCDGDPIQELF